MNRTDQTSTTHLKHPAPLHQQTSSDNPLPPPPLLPPASLVKQHQLPPLRQHSANSAPPLPQEDSEDSEHQRLGRRRVHRHLRSSVEPPRRLEEDCLERQQRSHPRWGCLVQRLQQHLRSPRLRPSLRQVYLEEEEEDSRWEERPGRRRLQGHQGRHSLSEHQQQPHLPRRASVGSALRRRLQALRLRQRLPRRTCLEAARGEDCLGSETRRRLRTAEGRSSRFQASVEHLRRRL